jgi:hypothetical protein
MNPYQAPAEEAPLLSAHQSEWYERLAKLKRHLSLSFLAQLGGMFSIIPLAFALGDSFPHGDQNPSQTLVTLWALLIVALWVNTQVRVFLVAKTVGTRTGALFTVLFLGLPLGGAIAVGIANQRATRALREGGYKVGFLGLKATPLRHA